MNDEWQSEFRPDERRAYEKATRNREVERLTMDKIRRRVQARWRRKAKSNA